MARRLGNGYVEMRLVISEEFYDFAARYAASQPLICCAEDFLTMELNTAMLAAMEREEDRLTKSEGWTLPPPREDGDDSDIPF